MDNPIANAFHKHLDECSRCRNNPFDLCDDGSILLNAAAIVEQRLIVRQFEFLEMERRRDGKIQEEGCRN